MIIKTNWTIIRWIISKTIITTILVIFRTMAIKLAMSLIKIMARKTMNMRTNQITMKSMMMSIILRQLMVLMSIKIWVGNMKTIKINCLKIIRFILICLIKRISNKNYNFNEIGLHRKLFKNETKFWEIKLSGFW